MTVCILYFPASQGATTVDCTHFLHVLLRASYAYIGIQTELVQCICAAD